MNRIDPTGSDSINPTGSDSSEPHTITVYGGDPDMVGYVYIWAPYEGFNTFFMRAFDVDYLQRMTPEEGNVGYSSPPSYSSPACGPDGYRDATPEEQAKVLSTARENIGKPYLPGAGDKSNPLSGFDCSGFVGYCINKAGIPYRYSPTSTMASNPALRRVAGETAQPGDVVLFSGHVGFNDPGQSSLGTLLSARSSVGINYGRPSWWGNVQDTYRIRVKCK